MYFSFIKVFVLDLTACFSRAVKACVPPYCLGQGSGLHQEIQSHLCLSWCLDDFIPNPCCCLFSFCYRKYLYLLENVWQRVWHQNLEHVFGLTWPRWFIAACSWPASISGECCPSKIPWERSTRGIVRSYLHSHHWVQAQLPDGLTLDMQPYCEGPFKFCSHSYFAFLSFQRRLHFSYQHWIAALQKERAKLWAAIWCCSRD